MEEKLTSSCRCPYCGSDRAELIARKVAWVPTTQFFQTKHSQVRCEACDLFYSHPVDEELRHGIERFFAKYYNIDRGAGASSTIAATWPDRDAHDVLRRAIWLCRRMVATMGMRNLAFGTGRGGEALALLKTLQVRRVLDIGCSFGAFVRMARYAGFEAYGVEPTAKIVEEIASRGITGIEAGFFPACCGPLERYDSLTMFQVLTHVAAPSADFFRACKDHLVPGGTLLVFGADPGQRHEVDLAFRSPIALTFTGRTFMERVASDVGFSSYAYHRCRGERGTCFHLLAR